MVLKIESTDSQAVLLQQRLAESGTRVRYQEEQHGPILVVCVQLEPGQEHSVRRIVADIGLRIRGDTDGARED
jgi:hypothetical protein